MRLLLDTQIALWAIVDDDALPQRARSLITEVRNTLYISSVSIWEIATKHALSRNGMPISGSEALHWFRIAGYTELAVTPAHAAETENLSALHADPFDRMLVAQSLAEPLRLLTGDATLGRYSDSVIVV